MNQHITIRTTRPAKNTHIRWVLRLFLVLSIWDYQIFAFSPAHQNQNPISQEIQIAKDDSRQSGKKSPEGGNLYTYEKWARDEAVLRPLDDSSLETEYVESVLLPPISKETLTLIRFPVQRSSLSASYVVGDLYLDEDRSLIAGDVANLLAQTVDLVIHHDARILVEGHCDDRGTAAYAFILGNRWVRVVEAYLIDLGVPADSISTVSYGLEHPRCAEWTATCWEDNLRLTETFRMVAISGPRNGCLVRLRVYSVQPDTRVETRRPPFLRQIHLALPKPTSAHSSY